MSQPILPQYSSSKYDHIVFADFESYFNIKEGYSLQKMPTINYVRDPRYQTLGCAVALDGEPSRYLTPGDLEVWFSEIDWTRTAFCAYNCLFDGSVLTQQYHIFPCYYICTLSAARALLPLDRIPLKAVAPLLQLGDKLDALVSGSHENTEGMDVYANQDNYLSRGVFEMLYPLLPESEHDYINLTIRQGVEPTLVLDREVLLQVRDDAISSREAAIKASGIKESVLSSNPQFAKLLVSMGLTPPTKLSEATGEETEAFANGDDEWVSFRLEYPEFKHIWDGRIAAKSNINITRAEKFLAIEEMGDGTTSMPLNYWGAHTGRASGADGLNVQNLPNKYKSNMRKAFTAPKGYVVGVADSSQIELRMNMWQAGQWDKLDLLRAGGCIYTAEAATQFNIDLMGQMPAKGMVDDDQRQYGKLCQLGLGFGMGGPKFRKTAAAGPLGMDPIYITLEQAYNTVNTYRSNNNKIPEFWRILDQRIHQMTLPGLNEQQGVVTFVHEGIVLPSGRMLQYPGLMQTEEGNWVYGVDKKTHFLWGGTLCENLTQALARDVVFEQMLKIDERYRVVSSTHDEVLFLVPEEEAEEGLAWALEIMSQSPVWAPDLPVSAEGAFAKYYCK